MPVTAAATGSRRVNLEAYGRFLVAIDAPGITPDNNVVASVTELDENANPKLGDATMIIQNVVPENDRVLVRGHVDWGDNLPIRVTIMFQ